MRTIFRIERKRDFTILPNALLRDSKLSFKARGVLAMILTNGDEWVVNAGWVQSQGTEGREAVKGALDELRDDGYARYEKAQDAHGQWTIHRWTFYDEPIGKQPIDGKPLNGKPMSGLPCTSEDHGKKIVRQKIIKTCTREQAEKLYQAYPKKAAHPKAIEVICSKLKQNNFDAMLKATKAFAEIWSGATDKHFCPFPQKWFGQERFNDAPETWTRPELSSSAPPKPSKKFMRLYDADNPPTPESCRLSPSDFKLIAAEFKRWLVSTNQDQSVY
jgi:hypothetical protein